MQGPTHLITGILLEKTVFAKSKVVRLTILGVVGVFLHSVMDRIAILTYHPPDADFSDPFWVGYHLVLFISFFVLLYFFGKKYAWGIFFSILPDFDWVFIHGAKILGIENPWYDQPYLHRTVHWFTDHIPPFSLLQKLPSHIYEKEGILLEAGLIIVMVIAIRLISSFKKRN